MPNSNRLTTSIMKCVDYLLMFIQNIQKYIWYTQNFVIIIITREKQNKTISWESCSFVIFIIIECCKYYIVLYSVIKWQYSDTENQVWQLSTKH